MAGPSIMVRVLGDLTHLASSFKEATGKGQQAAKALNEGFGQVLGALNKTGVLGPFGEALDGVNEAIGQVVEHAKNLGPAIAGAGAAVTAVGVGLSALGSGDKAAHQQLSATITATGHSFDDYADQIDRAVKSQEKLGHTGEQTENALNILTQATNDPAKALEYLSTASDLAAAKHEDLSSAATQLGKVYNGNTKLLKEFGIQVVNVKSATTQATTAQKQAQSADDNLARAKRNLADIELVDSQRKKLTLGQQIQIRNAEEAVTTATQKAREAHAKMAATEQAASAAAAQHGNVMTDLSNKLHGQASAAADTFSGHISAIKAHLEDVAATFGQKYGPAITAGGTAMTGFGAAMTTTKGVVDLFKKSTDAATDAVKAGQVATEASEAASVAADAAALPMLVTIGLIALAIVALAAVAYVVYRNWNTIWAAMKDAARDFAGFFIDMWGTVERFASIIARDVAGFFIRAWADIKGAFDAVIGWFETVWSKDIYGDIVQPIVRAFDAVVNFFEALPGDIARVATHMWDGIANAFVDAINFIIRIWDDLHFRAPSFSVFGHKIGGFDIGLPQIPPVPYLAQGGLITSEGLVYAHAGEVIAPIDKVPSGPAMYINTATFNEPVDVDLLTRRLEFALSAGLPV